MILIGDYVKWHDPALDDFDIEDREYQKDRVYEVIDIYENDIILIADDFGEVEVLEHELERL